VKVKVVPTPLFAFDPDAPAVPFDDLLADRQTQTEIVAVGATVFRHLIEPLEYLS